MVIVAWRMYNKPHRDVNSANVAYQVSADIIIGEYIENAQVAHEKYGGEIIILRGNFFKRTETEVGKEYIILKGKGGIVSCEIGEQAQVSGIQPEVGRTVQVKGICVGFDDLLGELQMKKCMVMSH